MICDSSLSQHAKLVDPGMDFVERRDVSGDGKQDVLLYRTSDGTNYTSVSLI